MNWSTFLRCSENKLELFYFLTVKNNILVMTDGGNVYSNGVLDLNNLMPCDIEEADERIFLHVKHIAQEYHKILIKTVDSDVVVIALSVFHRVLGISELWIEFGTGRNIRYIPIHQVASDIGLVKCQALLFFHAFSGCDTTSGFAGKGKKSFYEAWRKVPEITPLFCKLSQINSADDITEDEYRLIEKFVVVLYSRTCNAETVNAARRKLFAHENRTIENIPPTKAALYQHILRSVIQASKWYTCLEKSQDYKDPCEWGWKLNGGTFYPLRTELPAASQAYRELVKCACKNSCTAHCSCYKAELLCS